MNISAISEMTDFIWDFDGTLFDTYPYTINCFAKSCKSLGVECDKNEVYTLMMETIGVAFRTYEQRYNIGQELMDGYRKAHYRSPAVEGAPFAYAKEVLAMIKSSGRHNYMFTHRVNDVYPFMEYWETGKYFDFIVTLADGVKPKPSPEGVNLIVDKFKLNPQKTVMIGDREIDVLSGKNAGIKTCHITNSLPYKEFDVDLRTEGLKGIFNALRGKI